jgi:hypothetical protein
MKQDSYILSDEFKTTVNENAEIIKKYFKPNKSSSVFNLSKDLMILIRNIEGMKQNSWCSRSSIHPAIIQLGYEYINKRFSISFLNNKPYLKLLNDNLNLPSDIIRIILSKLTIDLIYCNRCFKIHYDTNKINHNTDFMNDKSGYEKKRYL